MAHVIVVGAGAIGSHLLPHIARAPYVSRITIVDRDRYDGTNLRSQQIDARHVGRPKAVTQAAILRRISRRLPVTAICAAVEDLPLGALRASVILAALDSRQARMVVNQATRRLGVPWIDAGVSADDLLARVRVLVPGADAPCLECGWDQSDYALVEQQYACAPDTPAMATNAPSGLAALAASLQAIECDTLLTGDVATSLAGREVVLSARFHTHFVTAFRRDPGCRMPDHDAWCIDRLGGSPDNTTLADALAHDTARRGTAPVLSVSVAGQRIATELRCRSCAETHAVVQLERHVRATSPRCGQCGHRLDPVGCGLFDAVPVHLLSEAISRQPLASIGLQSGDVLTLHTPDVDAHLEIGDQS